MKVAELLERRRRNWQELEKLCDQVAGSKRRTPPASIARFAALYRAACADLALADAYQMPPNTVEYLHRLVGRAHNQLYRSRSFDFHAWSHLLLHEVPQRVFNDRCVQVAFCLFWGVFLLAAYMAYANTRYPTYAADTVGEPQLEQMERDFEMPMGSRGAGQNIIMAAFYIRHNTGIGLQCFATGLLIVPGLAVLFFNAEVLGASFGYMARPDISSGKNFFEFVTAHGPFELTAIVLSAGAGLRLGVGWIYTRGYSRGAALLRTARDTLPLMCTAMLLFFFAALIEGFISPTSLPYWVKALVAILSSGLLMFYFIVLGFPRRSSLATR